MGIRISGLFERVSGLILRMRGGTMFLVRGKKGEVVSDETIKMIGYIGLLTAATFAVWKIVQNTLG